MLTRDEEDLMNQPVGNPPADARSQKMFETLASQSLRMLLSPHATELLLAAARAKGATQAIAEATIQVLQAALHAAQAAGVQVPDDVINAAAQPGVLLLAQAMAEAGFIDDPQAAARGILRQVDEAFEMPAMSALPEAAEAPGAQSPAADLNAGLAPHEREEF